MSKKKPTGKPVGRPRLNLPTKPRHFLQVERDETLDTSIEIIRKVLANRNNCMVEDITKARAVRYALAYVLSRIPAEEALK